MYRNAHGYISEDIHLQPDEKMALFSSLFRGREDVVIFDYADRQVPKLDRMFEKRLTAYRSIGYEPVASPPWQEKM
ncbi:hypothetical protein ACFL41_00265 [Gemmatimonadota bacterium]